MKWKNRTKALFFTVKHDDNVFFLQTSYTYTTKSILVPNNVDFDVLNVVCATHHIFFCADSCNLQSILSLMFFFPYLVERRRRKGNYYDVTSM